MIQVMDTAPKKNKKFKTFDDVLLDALVYQRAITIDKARFNFLKYKCMNTCSSTSARRNLITANGLQYEFIQFVAALPVCQSLKIDRAIAVVLRCTQKQASLKSGYLANHFSTRISQSNFLLEEIFRYIENLDSAESDWIDRLIEMYDIKVNKL